MQTVANAYLENKFRVGTYLLNILMFNGYALLAYTYMSTGLFLLTPIFIKYAMCKSWLIFWNIVFSRELLTRALGYLMNWGANKKEV